MYLVGKGRTGHFIARKLSYTVKLHKHGPLLQTAGHPFPLLLSQPSSAQAGGPPSVEIGWATKTIILEDVRGHFMASFCTCNFFGQFAVLGVFFSPCLLVKIIRNSPWKKYCQHCPSRIWYSTYRDLAYKVGIPWHSMIQIIQSSPTPFVQLFLCTQRDTMAYLGSNLVWGQSRGVTSSQRAPKIFRLQLCSFDALKPPPSFVPKRKTAWNLFRLLLLRWCPNSHTRRGFPWGLCTF